MAYVAQRSTNLVLLKFHVFDTPHASEAAYLLSQELPDVVAYILPVKPPQFLQAHFLVSSARSIVAKNRFQLRFDDVGRLFDKPASRFKLVHPDLPLLR